MSEGKSSTYPPSKEEVRNPCRPSGWGVAHLSPDTSYPSCPLGGSIPVEKRDSTLETPLPPTLSSIPPILTSILSSVPNPRHPYTQSPTDSGRDFGNRDSPIRVPVTSLLSLCTPRCIQYARLYLRVSSLSPQDQALEELLGWGASTPEHRRSVPGPGPHPVSLDNSLFQVAVGSHASTDPQGPQ